MQGSPFYFLCIDKTEIILKLTFLFQGFLYGKVSSQVTHLPFLHCRCLVRPSKKERERLQGEKRESYAFRNLNKSISSLPWIESVESIFLLSCIELSGFLFPTHSLPLLPGVSEIELWRWIPLPLLSFLLLSVLCTPIKVPFFPLFFATPLFFASLSCLTFILFPPFSPREINDFLLMPLELLLPGKRRLRVAPPLFFHRIFSFFRSEGFFTLNKTFCSIFKIVSKFAYFSGRFPLFWLGEKKPFKLFIKFAGKRGEGKEISSIQREISYGKGGKEQKVKPLHSRYIFHPLGRLFPLYENRAIFLLLFSF